METPAPCRSGETATTLYDVIAAIQEELTPEERDAGVAVTVVRDLLRHGALRPVTPLAEAMVPSHGPHARWACDAPAVAGQ